MLVRESHLSQAGIPSSAHRARLTPVLTRVMMHDMPNRLRGPDISHSLDASAAMITAMREREPPLERIIETVIAALRDGRKILTCGNGGSAAEALHLAEELIGRFDRQRRALPAICLAADSTALTCIANDFGYSEVFARQIDALGQTGDVLVALSTSGESPSIVEALKRARQRKLVTIGLLGAADSAAEPHCDLTFTLAGHTAARVQEAHLLAIHVLLEQVDAAIS